MPSLPGLAASGTPAMSGNGVSTATLNGWADVSDTRQEWTPTHPPVAPSQPTPPSQPSHQPVVPAPAIAAAPSVDALGLSTTGSQRRVTAYETAELPIFREAEAVWFRSHGRSTAPGSWSPAGPAEPNLGSRSAPTSPAPSYGGPPGPPPQAPTLPYVPPAAVPPPLPPMPPPSATPPPPPVQPTVPAGGPPPRQRTSVEEPWRTAADDGWRAAAAASEPSNGGTTRSGLPKRVPAAQLVPGGIDPLAAGAKARRTPDEVRGLLSAYHRGVQRGRTGDAGSPASRPTDEERH
jgi:hypothetical protein